MPTQHELADQIQAALDALRLTFPPTVPSGPPQTYPHLRSDRLVVPPTLLPIPQIGVSVLDPEFGGRMWRVTDAATSSGSMGGTLSAPNQCQVSPDDAGFFAMMENGMVAFYVWDPTAPVPFALTEQLWFMTEPTYSRMRPGVLYSPYYGYLITEYALAGHVRTTLFDVQEDVGPLSQANGQYMGVCYSSKGYGGTPERVICGYGKQGETHPYVTILDAANPASRWTVDVQESRIKANGSQFWDPLLNVDGSPANLHYGLHSWSIDHSGRWARLDISGNAIMVFFNVETGRVVQMSGADRNMWFGHYCWGDRESVV